VQTNPNDLPPPYAFQDPFLSCDENGDIAVLHIPRCPSYVMDPPKYQEILSDDEQTNIENSTYHTTIEFSTTSDVVA
jgi:hypothetical protein